MNKRITKNYLIGTFLTTYILWGIIIVANQFGYLKYGTPISMILYIIGGNAPPIIAYILLRKENIITGFSEFIKKAFSVKQKLLHYLLVILFLVLYFGVPALMQGISNGAKVHIGFLIIPLMILFGGLEELGWRYILQTSLEKRLSFIVATSLTAIIWAVWHLPLFYIEGTVQKNMNFGLFITMVFGMSFALAAIFYVSKSIWLCILFHSSINALSSTWIIDENIKIKIITTILLVIFSLITYFCKSKKEAYVEIEKKIQL